MTPSAAFSLAIVCEAPGDLRTSTSLADRVLSQEVEWINPESLDLHRRWRGMEENESHLEWHWVARIAKQQGLRIQGNFRGEPGALDANMARKALLLLANARQQPDAVVLIRDSDGYLDRVRGLEQARASYDWPFPIVLGVAHTKRECWVLAGFEPRTESERRILEDLRQELGSDPRLNAETLSAAEPGARRNAKRVLEALTGGDQDRESACWAEGDLQTLRERGFATGLADYLDEIRTRLVPVFSGGRPPRS
jgi:hypothetical protein